MDEAWERAVEAALGDQAVSSSSPPRPRSLTLDGSVKCLHGRLPPPEILERFQSLELLSIANIGVSSLEQFPRLRNLQRLILSDNRIAGGLEFLVDAGLGSLRDLDLSNNRIQFVEDLAPLAQLRLLSLDLYECPVTRIKDYRSKVFGMIRTLKYLDKMDSDENERPESDEEDEEEDDDDDDDEEDPGSGEVDGEDRAERLMTGGVTGAVGGIVDVDDEEESDAEEEDIENVRREDANGSHPRYHQSNEFRVAPARAASADRDEDEDEEEDVDDDYEDNDEDLGEEIDAEDAEEENVVEVHDIRDSDDDNDDGIEEDAAEEFDEDEEEYEDGERDEDHEDVEDEEDDGEPGSSGRLIRMEGEIDGHEQGEGDEDENGEIREDVDRYSEEGDGDKEEDREDVEDKEDGGDPGSFGRLMRSVEGEIDGHEQGEGEGDGDEDENENGEIGEEDENGEIREDVDRYSEEGDGDKEEDQQDVEDKEDGGDPKSSGRLMRSVEGEIDGHEQGEGDGDEDENENGEIGEEDEMDDEEGEGEDEYEVSSQSTKIALLVFLFGSISFICGIVAENKKPPSGFPIQGKGVVICKYPNDPSIALGAFSVVTLVLTAVLGHVAVYFPYEGKSVPTSVLFQSTTLLVFYIIAELVTAAGILFLMWATISEGIHRSNIVHHDTSYNCPTAMTGVFGGGAFLALDAALFWLACQMLTTNVRTDYLGDDEDAKGEYGEVYATELNAAETPAS